MFSFGFGFECLDYGVDHAAFGLIGRIGFVYELFDAFQRGWVYECV
jgi:hypothetical protein